MAKEHLKLLSLYSDFHLVHHIDDIRVFDGWEPVSDGDARPTNLATNP
jgi:hypothetical protein